ncbi:hypothetical protein RHMOL_Rhmol01G0230000 [Rhododendron molle]|uniref:Uncharacterized protein n=1 Tax=Rhododendron molle TaxID=49168 RepID=A0ACC0Q4Y8_RHOML|nr:hypothetical protein RHMOL_Rhmol01G0230000 [Rhododendron molle]
MLGIPKSNKRGRRKKKKCSMFRSAVAAATLSTLSEGTNRLHFDDAKTARSIESLGRRLFGC